jgi:tetratricopeptide (TPR) repeat protein
VGREIELGRLENACRDATRVVEVTGESGIGKTRLVAEVARRLAPTTTVLWGRCAEDSLGAYTPFVEALRRFVFTAEPSTLAAVVGSRGDLRRIVTDIEDVVGPLPPSVTADAGTEQRLVFESVEAVLAAWSPAILVLDDLHWADSSTMSLLGYLARSEQLPHLTIICTARPTELGAARSGALADLSRHVEVKRIGLRALDRAELAILVSDLIGGRPSESLIESVLEAADGNPFLSEEVTVQLVDEGRVQLSDVGALVAVGAGSRDVPERVRDTVGRRLLSLSSDAVELLSIGSIIGREFALGPAGSICGFARPRLVDAADDAIVAGLLTETSSGQVMFSHALVQQAIRDRNSTARQAEMHRRVAEELQTEWPAKPAMATELAHHWAAAATIDSSATTMAAVWAVRAGDVALAAAGADEAIANYETAVSLWEQSTSGHADALVRLGLALHHKGRADDADLRFRQALQLAIALGDSRVQSRAAIGLGRRYPYWETDTARIDAMENALAALPAEEEALRLTLKGLLVTHLINGFHTDEANRRDELATELAAIASDPKASESILRAMGQTRVYDVFDDPVALTKVAGRLAAVGAATSDLRVLAGARFALALSCLDLGEMPGLIAAVEDYAAVAHQLDDPREISQAETARATIAFIEGRYGDAEKFSISALDHGKASGDFNADLIFYAQGLLRAVDLGQAADVLPLLLDATEYQRISAFSAGTALCAALAGEWDLANRQLDTLMTSGLSGSPVGADWLSSTSFLAHACATTGAVGHAQVLYDNLAERVARVVRVGPMAGWWGPVDHHLGRLARLLGRLDLAESHLRKALAIERSMGAKAFEARSGAELAAVLAAGGAGTAGEVAEHAIGQAAALGAAGIMAEVETALSTVL